MSLAIRRHRAPVGEARTRDRRARRRPRTGGDPVRRRVRRTARPDRRDARSDRLRPARDRALARRSPARPSKHGPTLQPVARRAWPACASQLGPARAFYSTADSVADIEAIRRAGGYEKLVLYGTSYGTKLAELYAQAYPQHVEALVLDSVVPPAGPDAFDRPTFAALPQRAALDLRAGTRAAASRADPFADLARVLARMHDRRLRDPCDRPARARAPRRRDAAEALLNALAARRLLGPAASGARDAPTARRRSATTRRSGGCSRRSRPKKSGGEGIRRAAVLRDELRRPGLPLESHGERRRRGSPQAGAAARALGRARLRAVQRTRRDRAQRRAPVRGLALLDAVRAACPPAQLPPVPTLILSGAEDLRTPTSGAREVPADDPRLAPAGGADGRPLGARQRPERLRRTGSAGALPRHGRSLACRRGPTPAAAAPGAAAAASARAHLPAPAATAG